MFVVRRERGMSLAVSRQPGCLGDSKKDLTVDFGFAHMFPSRRDNKPLPSRSIVCLGALGIEEEEDVVFRRVLFYVASTFASEYDKGDDDKRSKYFKQYQISW